MKIKRVLSLLLGFSGAILTLGSITKVQVITGAVVGANSVSKSIGIIGILLMVVAVIIENHELKK